MTTDLCCYVNQIPYAADWTCDGLVVNGLPPGDDYNECLPFGYNDMTTEEEIELLSRYGTFCSELRLYYFFVNTNFTTRISKPQLTGYLGGWVYVKNDPDFRNLPNREETSYVPANLDFRLCDYTDVAPRPLNCWWTHSSTTKPNPRLLHEASDSYWNQLRGPVQVNCHFKNPKKLVWTDINCSYITKVTTGETFKFTVPYSRRQNPPPPPPPSTPLVKIMDGYEDVSDNENFSDCSDISDVSLDEYMPTTPPLNASFVPVGDIRRVVYKSNGNSPRPRAPISVSPPDLVIDEDSIPDSPESPDPCPESPNPATPVSSAPRQSARRIIKNAQNSGWEPMETMESPIYEDQVISVEESITLEETVTIQHQRSSTPRHWCTICTAVDRQCRNCNEKEENERKEQLVSTLCDESSLTRTINLRREQLAQTRARRTNKDSKTRSPPTIKLVDTPPAILIADSPPTIVVPDSPRVAVNPVPPQAVDRPRSPPLVELPETPEPAEVPEEIVVPDSPSSECSYPDSMPELGFPQGPWDSDSDDDFPLCRKNVETGEHECSKF